MAKIVHRSIWAIMSGTHRHLLGANTSPAKLQRQPGLEDASINGGHLVIVEWLLLVFGYLRLLLWALATTHHVEQTIDVCSIPAPFIR